MLRNEAANDGAAQAMGQKSAEGGLINGVLDDLKSPTAAAIAVGAAVATVAAIKFGGPLLARGAQAAEEATSIASGALKQGETCVLGIVRDGKIEPATDAILTHSKPIGSIEPATDAILAGGHRIPHAADNAYFATGADSPFLKPPFSDALRRMEVPHRDLHATGIYGHEYPNSLAFRRSPGEHESWSDLRG